MKGVNNNGFNYSLLLFLVLMNSLLITGASFSSDIHRDTFVFTDQGSSYTYTVIKTGENYSFKFQSNPGILRDQLRAGLHVLRSVYGDSSIKRNYCARYLKERAKCFVFDSFFHTYTLCFFPNDFSPENRDRFWGYITRVPNWRWLFTYNFLPAAMLFSLLFFYPGKSAKKTRSS